MQAVSTLVDLLRSRAAQWPERRVYTFLMEGEEEGGSVTLEGLDAEARSIAALLRRAGLAGERALLVYPPGLEFIAAFFGCLYAGMTAVPVYPPGSRRTVPRLIAIARDARPAAVLTSAEAHPRLSALLSGVPELSGTRWLITNGSEREPDEPFLDPGVGADTLAFLQYTSGSTSTPKGVMVSHGNLLSNQEAIRQAFGQSEESIVVGWLPLYHDMGLIGNVLQPLYVGARCILMSPMAFLARPVRWLQAISRYRGTTSGGPNFAYDLCARRITPEEREGLALDSWRVAFNGAEAVRSETLERFAAEFAPQGFRGDAFFPCYGLAEATLFVTGGRPGEGATVLPLEPEALRQGCAVPALPEEPARRLVASGRADLGLEVVIADPEAADRCPPGRIGEIWISGPSVAQGYWGRLEATDRDFRARLRGEEHAGPFLRTGDLGFLHDGSLYVTGRLKDLIIVRGRNHYPQDIELTVEESHPALRQGACAAFSVEAGGEERLVIACELTRHAEAGIEATAAAARRAVAAEHEVGIHEVVLLRFGTLPKTSSGKVQRHACRAGYLEGTLEVVGRSAAPDPPSATPDGGGDETGPPERVDLLVRHLAARAARLPAEGLGGGTPLTAAGLDSLGAVELRQALEARWGVDVPLADLLDGITLDELIGRVLASLEEPPTASVPLAADGSLVEGPLSFGQRSLWFLHRLAPESAAYNIAVAARVLSPLDAEALRRSLETLVRRHPALRTTFPVQDGEPWQRVAEDPALDFSVVSALGWNEEELRARMEQEARRPFDLANGPLLRTAIFAWKDGAHAVVLTVHHAVADFTSMAILARELGAPEPSAAPGITYLDFARWQQERLAGEEGERLWEEWHARLLGAPLQLDLPTDRPRPPVQTYEGQAVSLRLDPERTAAIGALARSRNATLHAVLLSGFQALLHRYTGQEDFLVGSPAAGRTRPEFQDVVGYFVNPVILRADFAGLPSFTALLDRTRRDTLGALELQDFPLPLLVERLQPERDPSRAPLFQALFVLQQGRDPGESALGAFALGEPGARLALGELDLESIALDGGSSQVDLTLSATPLDGGLVLALRFNTDLYDAATVRRALGHLDNLLAGALAEPDRPVAELPLLSAPELRQLEAWNSTAAPGGNRCLHELFEESADRAPDAVAVTHFRESVTYRELEERANQLAAHLRTLGVRPETRVGVLLERTPELPMALLAILKAGGAYVPLDPAYPRERNAFMLDDSGAPLVVTRSALAALALPEGAACHAVRLDVDAAEIAGRQALRPPPWARPESLAYLIYTSGSTGRPKGVAIEHRRAAALARWAGEVFPPEDLEGVFFSTSVCFDLSVFELFAPLAHGGRVFLASDALELPSLPAAGEVRLVNTVPSVLAELLAAGALPAGVRTVCLAGEPLHGELARRIQDTGTVHALWNLYGPSEDTTYSTFARIPRDGGEPSIGLPLAGKRAHVLDRRLQPLPVGVPGELYLGGAGLARGYLGRPDLTAERFAPAPGGEPGERLYRTGDLARRRPDGELEFLGRIDHQVKIRGFRIELGEIESTLARQPGVREAVVLAREDAAGDRRLVAWVVPDAAPPAEWEAELRAGLRQRLPEVMVPSDVVVLPALPRTPNGKVDRRALPEPRRTAAPAAAPAAGRPLAELVASVWAGVLGVDRIGLEESFFERGGHSLLAARAVARLNAALAVDLPLSAVFEAPTVSRFAERIESDLGVARDLPSLARLPRLDGEAPASFAQERLWFLDQLAPGSPVYNMAALQRMSGDLAPGLLERALRAVQQRHESLRTTFRPERGGPRQVVAPEGDLTLPLVDLSGLDGPARESELRWVLAGAARRPFDLAAGPLLRGLLVRCEPAEHHLLLTCHHTVADGWSLRGIVARDLAAFYTSLAAGADLPSWEPEVRYTDWAQWQRQCLEEERLRREMAHWQRRLEGAPRLELPADRPRPAARGHQGGVRRQRFPEGLARGVDALVRREGATRFMVFLAVFQALLGRLASQDDVTVGTVMDQRDKPELEEVVGLFVNTLPLRGDLAGDPPFAVLVTRTRAACLDAWAHRDLPFEKLVEARRAHPGGEGMLFDVAFTQQEDPPLPAIEGFDLSLSEVHTGTAKFDLTLLVTGAQEAALEFADDLFDSATAERWLEGWTALLNGALERPDARVSDLPLLGASARHQVLVEWNDTSREGDPERDLPVHERVAARAVAAPAALAVAVASDAGSLTYRQLDRWANGLAWSLAALGPDLGEPVGVLAGRGPALIAGLLGVLKAGAAYLPLDPVQPADRLAFMARDAGVRFVVAERGLADLAAACGASVVLLDEVSESEAGPEVAVPLESLAYVIYTSGSTGQPKGVEVPHSGLLNLVRWHLGAYELSPADRVTQLAGLGFDASVWEIWPCLAAGASLHLAPEEVRLSPPRLRDWLARKGISLSFVPTPLAEAALEGPWPEAPSLRALLTGGDRLHRRPPASARFRLVNHYGPTESSVVATAAPVPAAGAGAPLIGRPVDGTRAYLLDAELRPVPPGVPGELYLSGTGLARGYRGQPGLTAERFIPDLFAAEPGGRLYRTGDRARHLPDGSLDFLGRIDDQVKLRGVRIEPGEIEAALARHPDVSASAVVLREDTPGEPRLVAYVVAVEGRPKSEAAGLGRFLRALLPEVMVPAVFVWLEALPLTAHGKVDRRALPPPAASRTSPGAGWVAPRTPLEEVLAGMWSEVLGAERVGVHDDFFELGGHSLLAAELVAVVRETFDQDVPLRSFLEVRTVAGLAEELLAGSAARARIESTAEVLLQLSRLSDLEVEAALARTGVDLAEGEAS